jgi:uncharacterized protein with PIN domain
VRVAPELRFLLAPRRRPEAGRLPVPTDGTSSAVHLLESIGIPRTEIGPVSIDDRPASRTEIPGAGQVMAVAPIRRPQRGAQQGFLLDVGLGGLARALRLLGLDAEYSNDAADRQLVARAALTGRVLLTQDRGLLRRRELPRGALVRGSGTNDQLADVLTRFAPDLCPWSRCPRCNGALAAAEKQDVAGRLEPGTRRSYQRFSTCTGCGHVYWRGAHEAALSRRIAWSHALVARARAMSPQHEEDRAQAEHEHAATSEQDQPRGGREDTVRNDARRDPLPPQRPDEHGQP